MCASGGYPQGRGAKWPCGPGRLLPTRRGVLPSCQRHARSTGGDPPEAALSALYFCSLQYAFDQGVKAGNFMGTRAFPDDGLFQFKRKWGVNAGVKFPTLAGSGVSRFQ